MRPSGFVVAIQAGSLHLEMKASHAISHEDRAHPIYVHCKSSCSKNARIT